MALDDKSLPLLTDVSHTVSDRPASLALRAGPLTVLYETGGFRNVRFGNREIVRRILLAVRDGNWGTVPNLILNTHIDQGEDWFQIRYDAISRQREIDFAWSARLSGDAHGALTFTFDGQAQRTFRRNRLGLVVLHPIRECAGAPCRVEQVDGQVVESVFPLLISPHHPFEDMRAVAHLVLPGLWAEVRFSGETFEMEDQRNWTDASFKTYGTPGRLPFPVEVPAGTRLSQSVTLTLLGAMPPLPTTVNAEPALTIGTEPVGRLPRLGLGQASHDQPLSPLELDRLRSLRLSHLRTDVRFGDRAWPIRLRRAASEAHALGVELEVALHLSTDAGAELAQLLSEMATLRLAVARWLLYCTNAANTSEPVIRLARERLTAYAPTAPLIGGTDAYFMQLNSQRPPVELLDGLCYSINPQVHAFDTSSLMETCEAQTTTVRSAQRFAAGKRLSISPLTLRPRFNPAATGPEPGPAPGELPPEVDPRQVRLVAAAWTVASLQALAETGAVDSLTYYETTGWRGVIEVAAGSPLPQAFSSLPGMAFPLYHLFADLGGWREAEILRLGSTEPQQVAGVALRRGAQQAAIVANLTTHALRLRLAGIGQTVRVRCLDQDNVLFAAQSPEEFRAQAGEQLTTRNGQVTLALGAYAFARLEW